MAWQKERILITVKTYPNPSQKYTETVCVAGVLLTTPPSWIRLYPVPFRDLPLDQQFKKFQVIEAEITKNKEDFRPESHKIRADSLKIVDTIDSKFDWSRRKEILLPLLDRSMCQIQNQQKETQKSLGIFRPKAIENLAVEEIGDQWTKGELQVLSQQDFFRSKKKTLEKIPYKFSFSYFCLEENCKGHKQSIIDWEIMQLFQKTKKTYPKEKLPEKIRHRYLNEVCGPDRDPFFIVGNQMKGPVSFMILSVFWPPKTYQTELSFS